MPARVPFNDLSRRSTAKTRRAIERVLERGHYVLGPETTRFEERWARFCETAGAVGVGNGTDAIELGLKALGVEAGSEVITVANAGMYSATAILACGATPVFVDVLEDTLTMDPRALDGAFSARTSAVVVTHLYGLLADVEQICETCSARAVPVLEDCAQAHGAQDSTGRRAGSFGAAGAFSFYPTKNLGAVGDGGAVTASDPAVLNRLRQLRQYGWVSRYDSRLGGGRNSRLDELQAAVLSDTVDELEQRNATRRAVLGRYRQAAAEGGGISSVGASRALAADHVAHLAVFRATDRAKALSQFEGLGIAAAVHYPIPDPRQVTFARAPWRAAGGLEVTERACSEVFSLPLFPELTPHEIERVCAALAGYQG